MTTYDIQHHDISMAMKLQRSGKNDSGEWNFALSCLHNRKKNRKSHLLVRHRVLIVIVQDVWRKRFVSTLRPQLSKAAVWAAMSCAEIARKQLFNPDTDLISLTTGNVAEPMLPHFGDVDIMYYETVTLAIPRGHSPPTQLVTRCPGIWD